ncbi:MAG: GNAT family N-acetyltransferase [Minicystis sp.]
MITPPLAPPTFVDLALSRRLEEVEIAQHRAAVSLISAALPERGAAALALAGGVLAYCGAPLSLSRALGLSLGEPFTAADADALEAFYRSRACPAVVLLSPFADESIYTRLGERGFRLEELDSVLIRPLAAADAQLFPAGEISVDRAPAAEARAWVRHSIASFSGSDSAVPDGSAAIYESAFSDPAATYFYARCDGEIAGTGAMYVHAATSYFFATSTAPAFRGRGVQAALIAARLSLSQEMGCTLAYSRTAAGGPSQRNLERAGFRSIYSRAVMKKRFS